MSSPSPTIVFGAANVGVPGGHFDDDSSIHAALSLLHRHGVRHIDTAQRYAGGRSEEALGRVRATGPASVPNGSASDEAQDFVIDTKWVGGANGPLSAAEIEASARRSISKLGVDHVDVFYMHVPDRHTPLPVTLAAINQVFQAGLFRRFGLSNYTAQEVQEVYDTAKEHGYVLPSVYQGPYNAVARRIEEELFPVLRQLHISFYAYSPIGGGFLTKTRGQVEEGAGRFAQQPGPAGQYRDRYCRPGMLAALDEWGRVADSEGISRSELAYRWTVYHGGLRGDHGDSVIIGARDLSQLEETLHSIDQGRLSVEAVQRITRMWKDIRDESPGYAYED